MGDLVNLCIRDVEWADQVSALRILAQGVVEVPLYRWLIGDDPSGAQARRWAHVLFAIHVDDGARGVFDQSDPNSTGMRGLALWSSPARRRPVDDDLLRRLVGDMGRADEGFLYRYREMMAADAAAWTPPASYDVVFVAVDPELRRAGVLTALADHVVALADEHRVPLMARASDPGLAAAYERRWSTTPRAEYTPGGGPRVQILQRDPAGI